MAHFSLRFEYLTSALTTIVGSTEPQLALTRNDNRGNFTISVKGKKTVYIGLGFQPSNTAFTFFLQDGDFYVDSIGFKGPIYVTCDATGGETLIQFSEFSK